MSLTATSTDSGTDTEDGARTVKSTQAIPGITLPPGLLAADQRWAIYCLLVSDAIIARPTSFTLSSVTAT